MKILLFLTLIIFPLSVSASPYEQLEDAANTDSIYAYYETEILPELEKSGIMFDMKKLTSSIYSGNTELSPSGLLHFLSDTLTGNFRQSLSSLGIILIIALLCGLLSNLAHLGGGGARKSALYICFGALCCVCAASFSNAVEAGIRVINLMSDFVKVSVPAMAALTAASGRPATSSLLSPVLYSAAAVAISVSSAYIVPLVYGAFSLSAAGCIGEDINLDRLVVLLKSAARWIMSVSLTVFSVISAAGSTIGGALNAASGKAVRFAVGSFIPMVGGMLSDSIDMAVACTSLVKKSAGIGVMAVLILLFLSVASKLILHLWLFRIAAAVSSPIGEKRISALLDSTADCISTIFAAVCMCSFLFLVIITFMITF